MKYVVIHRNTGLYLAKSYCKDKKQTENIKEAYQFSAFSLLLASKTFLSEKNKYIVYPYTKELEKELLDYGNER